MTADQGGSPALGDSLIDRSDRNDEGHKRELRRTEAILVFIRLPRFHNELAAKVMDN
ncbi:MAG: hypothetical protein HY881_20415 [Deltaproteobacteria bacterium]|nr:hypothetical protein [Deltaproteobacteria bacterium]